MKSLDAARATIAQIARGAGYEPEIPIPEPPAAPSHGPQRRAPRAVVRQPSRATVPRPATALKRIHIPSSSSNVEPLKPPSVRGLQTKSNAPMPSCNAADQEKILRAIALLKGSGHREAKALVKKASLLGLCRALHGMRRWYTYNCWNAAKKILAVRGALSSAMDLSPPIGAFRGFKVDKKDPLARLREGEIVKLPVTRNGACSSWTLGRELADRFSGASRTKVGLVIQFVGGRGVQAFLAPPERSKAWFNDLYAMTMGRSHRHNEREYGVCAASLRVRVVRVKGSP